MSGDIMQPASGELPEEGLRGNGEVSEGIDVVEAVTGEDDFDVKDIESGRVVAALGYIGILVIIPFLLEPNNPYCKANAKQALILFFLATLLAYTNIGGLLSLVIAIVCFIKALEGDYWKVPIVHDLAEKLPI